MQNGLTEKLKNDYKKKGMQSQVFAGQENESLAWLNTNITPQKTAGAMDLREQMVETREWNVLRGIGCGTENVDSALMVLVVSWAVERELLPANTAWYMRKTSSARRPDLT